MVNGAWVCLLAPLAGFLAITLAGNRITRRQAGILSTVSVFVGFAGAVVAFIDALSRDSEDRAVTTTAWTWLAAGDFKVSIDLLVDPLSITMMLVVTGIGGLIVLYSNGYMEGEDEERRYFAYMSLFVFSMLLLVMGGNLLLLLVGWGLVGLASYLLIGFYHDRSSAIDAAKKAFVINTVGDAAMALALFLAIAKVGSLDYSTVFDAAQSGELSDTVVTLLALGLLAGAVAKSAQIPLHTWLPDAMEGPTPVSALIHAATMVTAGVYLICRTHLVFQAAPDIQHLAAVLGLITLLVAGAIALVQWDIKRVIAYSTMSQIGYMFVGAGIGAYPFAMFHLVTHAFFKALLFLAAGLVIHHLDGEQDIRKMGGLAKSMPYTRWTFLIGSLSLAGIPIFAGFWSKDAIISSTLAYGGALGWILYIGGLLGRCSPASTPSASTSASSTASRASSSRRMRTVSTRTRVRGRCSCPWASLRLARRSSAFWRSRASGSPSRNGSSPSCRRSSRRRPRRTGSAASSRPRSRRSGSSSPGAPSRRGASWFPTASRAPRSRTSSGSTSSTTSLSRARRSWSRCACATGSRRRSSRVASTRSPRVPSAAPRRPRASRAVSCGPTRSRSPSLWPS